MMLAGAIRALALGALRCATLPLRLLPVKRRRVFVMPARKGMNGNLDCIADYLAKHGPDGLEIVWGDVRSEGRVSAAMPGAKRFLSPSWFFHAMTSRVILTNDWITMALPKRRGQVFVNTWHAGGAYKKSGVACLADARAVKARVRNYNRMDLYLSSSELFTRHCLGGGFQYRGEILNSGMPRNDIFFSRARRDAAAEEIRRKYRLADSFVALYAPTYRGTRIQGYRTDFRFPYELVRAGLGERFGRPVRILKRAHPGGMMSDSPCEGVIDVTGEPDMQALLCAADVLITDYSSCIWDYALLGRPCLLYMPDLADYDSEQGFFTPVEQWPGILCRDAPELEAALQSFDERECAESARRYLRESGSYETGDATRQVCDWILGRLSEGN